MPFITVPHQVTQISIDGISIFLGYENGVIAEFSKHTGQPIFQYYRRNVETEPPVSFMTVHRGFLYALIGGNVYQWDTRAKIYFRNFTKNYPSETTTFIIANDTLITFHENTFANAWELSTGTSLTDPQVIVTTPIYSIVDYKPVDLQPDDSKADSFIYVTRRHVLHLNKQSKVTTKLFDIDPSGPYDPQVYLDGNTLYVRDTTNAIHRKYLHDPSINKGVYAQKFALLFPYDDYLFVAMDKRIKLTSHNGYTVAKFTSHTSYITALCARDNILVSASESGQVAVEAIDIPEEDTTYFSHVSIENEAISSQRSSVSDCTNVNIFSLSPYTTEDAPIMVYLPNSNNTFSKALCMTIDELTAFLQSDLHSDMPTNIMSIYSRPRIPDNSGIGSHPSGKIVIKLPANNVYVTFGSIKRVLLEHKNATNTIWYAVPLFGGKKRRIGNIRGFFGVSMNHGQIPGFLVYKLFSPNDIHDINGIVGKESKNDWPGFLVNAAVKLSSIINVDSQFTDLLLNDLTS